MIESILSFSGLVSMIIASLLKGKHMDKILFFVFCGNFLMATSYLLGTGINGAIACYFGALQSIINYFFQRKNLDIPMYLSWAYFVISTVINIWLGGFNFLSCLVIVASLTFILGIIQKTGAGYRFWTIVNMCLWCIYDILSKSYSALFTHVSLLIFTVAGMIINDRKNS